MRKEESIKNLKKKYIIDFLKMEDIEENNRRLERLREQKRKEYEEKIAVEALRLQQLRAEKEKGLNNKKKIQATLEQEKAQILREFERNKKLMLSNLNNKSHPNLSFDIRAESPYLDSSLPHKNPQTVKARQRGAVMPQIKTESNTNKSFSPYDKPSAEKKNYPPRVSRKETSSPRIPREEESLPRVSRKVDCPSRFSR